MTLESVTRAGVVLLTMSFVACGCSTAGVEKQPERATSPTASTSDFETIENTLDSAGWSDESAFDWSDLGSSSQIPEVRAALPSMSSWVETSIFSDEANNATSTLDMLEGIQSLVGLREYDNLVEEHQGDTDEGLENAAAYGLVVSPNVEMSTDPRVAVSTEVKEAEDKDSAAVIEMTARAAIPLTNGSINRWGVYVYSLEFTVPKGYESGGDWWAGTSVSTKSAGLMTCDWTTNYSANVAEDGVYDPSYVREVIEFAGPRESFSRADLRDGIGKGPDIKEICEP